jgi:O-antigen ligase
LAILFREARSKWVYLVVVLVLAVGLLLIPPFYWQRILSIGEVFSEATHDWSLMLRLLAIKTAWQLFLQHPLTGVGINNFWVRSATDLPARIVVHNAYLEILVSIGIVGFSVFWVIVASGVRGYWRALKARWDPECRWMNDLSYYFLLSFGCTLIGAMFEAIQWKYELWLPIALGLTMGRICRDTQQNTKNI